MKNKKTIPAISHNIVEFSSFRHAKETSTTHMILDHKKSKYIIERSPTIRGKANSRLHCEEIHLTGEETSLNKSSVRLFSELSHNNQDL